MAQKKVTIELSIVELQHLRSAVFLGNTDHQDSHGRSNPALDRVSRKIDEAERALDTEPEEAGVPSKQEANDEQGD